MGARASECRWSGRASRSFRLGAVAACAFALRPAVAEGASATLPAPRGSVDVEAGSVTYDAATERYLFTDGVRVRRGVVLLRARTGRYDPRTGDLDAEGDVLLTSPGRVVAADGMHAVIDGPWEAHHVSTFFKSKPLNLDGAKGAAEAVREGRNRVSLWADEAHGTAPLDEKPTPFTAESARLTLCDCGSGAPSWEIHARKAVVTPGESAILTWPVIYVTPRFLFIDTPIPVLPLPWLYVPLADRQTGFLVPTYTIGSRGGFELGEPFFLTLGRSWDATFSAAYAFGPSSSQVQGSLGAVPQSDPGLRGLDTSAEVRWAPAVGVGGEAKLYFMRDTLPYLWKPGSGDRLALTLHEASELDPATFVNAELGLVGDAAYEQDFAADVLLRNAPYLRSEVALGHAFPDVLVEADASYNLEVATLGQPGVPVVPFGVFGGRVPSFHRLPAVSATLEPVRLTGPVLASGEVGLARFAPISGFTDQSVNGVGPGERLWPFQPGLPLSLRGPPFPFPPPSGDAWIPGQRLAADRAYARAELRAPVPFGSFLEVEPWVAGTGSGYLFDSGARPALLDGWAGGGAVLSTRLERVYGQGDGALRHVVEPRFEWRAGTGVAGPALPAYAYDEVDAAPVVAGAPCVAPGALSLSVLRGGCLPLRSLSSTLPGGYSQVRVDLRNRLVGPSGKQSATRLELDLGQDFDLSGSRLGETWVRGGVGWGPVSGSLLARFLAFGATAPPGSWAALQRNWLDHFTQLQLNLDAADARSDHVGIQFLALGSSASAGLKAGLDPMFDSRPIPFQPMAQVNGSIKVRVLGGLDVQWDAILSLRSITTFGAGVSSPDAAPYVNLPGFQQNAFTASWTSPCDCWRALVKVTVSPGFYNVSAGLDLSQLSGFHLAP